MNRATFDERWPLIRSRVGARWSLMAGTDLVKVDKSEVKLDKFLTLLQVKYGYTRAEAKVQADLLWAEYEASRKDIEQS